MTSDTDPLPPDFQPKLGRLESPPDYPRVFLGRYLATNLGPPPPSSSFMERIPKFPIMLNDTYGDCVVVAQAHHIQIATAYGTGQEKIVPDSVIKTSYFTQTGGRDVGLNIPRSLDYWVKHGLGGFKLSAWASADPRDHEELMHSVNIFGSVNIGLNLPSGYLNEFRAGVPWENTRPAANGGGHAVLGVAYDQNHIYLATWGRVQKASWKWMARYCTDAEVLLSPEWQLNVVTPGGGGVDLASLYGAFESLTGRKPPIPDKLPDIDWKI